MRHRQTSITTTFPPGSPVGEASTKVVRSSFRFQMPRRIVGRSILATSILRDFGPRSNPVPYEFMFSSSQCHRDAAWATIRSARNRASRAAGLARDLNQYSHFPKHLLMREFRESHSAVANKIAQQVQDIFSHLVGLPRVPTGAILWHMRTAPPGEPDMPNILSLGGVAGAALGYEFRGRDRSGTCRYFQCTGLP